MTLFGALDQFYAALAAANYDFTKINPSVEAPLDMFAIGVVLYEMLTHDESFKSPAVGGMPYSRART